MRTYSATAFVTLMTTCLVSCGQSQPQSLQASESAWISLESRTIDIRAPELDISEHLQVDMVDSAARNIVLVKFPGPIDQERDRLLRASVETVYTYLPHFAYLVRVPEGMSNDELMRATGASWVGFYHPQYKISRAIAGLQSADTSASPKSVMLHVYPDADLGQVVATLRQLGVNEIPGFQRGAFFSRIRMLLSAEQIIRLRERIAQLPEVFWIELEARRVLFNDTTIWVGQSGLNANQSTPLFSRGIQGQGQVVAVLDTGIDPDMCYFRDTNLGLPPRNECNGGTVVDTNQRKVIAVDFLASGDCNGGISATDWDNQDHGSHVAGTVAGDNFANPLLHDAGDGMAPAAKLVIQDGGFGTNVCADLPGIGCPVVDLKPIFQQTYDQGARIHSNSWGDQEENAVQNNYTAGSQDADELMWNHKDFLLIFAAGNSGPGDATVSSPSTAKSVLSVGATQRATGANNMASFSSCGWTDDGRFKPEIVAPGSSIVSANSDNNPASNNCNTRTMSGTSMATPAVAGLAALVRQYYMDGWYPSGIFKAIDGFTPSAALVRATVVNSGEPLTNATPIPGTCQGWGRVLLDNSLYFSPETRTLWVKDEPAGFVQGSTNETQSFKFTVKAAGAPFKATLAWTDFPSTPAAFPHINNDLDLEVSGPDGLYLGNVLSMGQSTMGGNPDRLNTLEQVVLPNPVAGEYTVTVRSFNVPNGPQPFALVVTGNASVERSLGAACNGADDCDSGFCADGVCCNSACDAGACDACTTGAGALKDGTCRLLNGTSCDDGNACTTTDTCVTGVCSGANPVVCPMPDACHEAGSCNSMTGECVYPAKPDGSTCDDSNACSQVDVCQSGTCTGTSFVECVASDVCHDAGVCDSATGTCSNPEKPEGTSCDDGNACTMSDSCVAGTCVPGSAKECAAIDECHEVGNCDSGTGACSSPAKPDGTTCSIGLCIAGVCTAQTSSSSSSGAGGNGGMGEGGAAGSGGESPRPPLVLDSGCGCRTANGSDGGMAGIGLGLLLVLRRRRRMVS